MSGHTRWEILRDEYGSMEDSPAKDRMISYVQGYLLALEDTLKDIDEVVDDGARYPFLELIAKVTQSLESAKCTMEVLTK